MFTCESLHLLPSTSGGRLSDGDGAGPPISEYNKVSLGIISLTFYCCSVIFGSTLGLKAIKLPVPGHPGPVGTASLLGLGSQVRMFIYWPLPQAYFACSTALGKRFCGWVGLPVPQLEVFPSYGKWIVQAPYPIPLSGFTSVWWLYHQMWLLSHGFSFFCSIQ